MDTLNVPFSQERLMAGQLLPPFEPFKHEKDFAFRIIKEAVIKTHGRALPQLKARVRGQTKATKFLRNLSTLRFTRASDYERVLAETSFGYLGYDLCLFDITSDGVKEYIKPLAPRQVPAPGGSAAVKPFSPLANGHLIAPMARGGWAEVKEVLVENQFFCALWQPSAALLPPRHTARSFDPLDEEQLKKMPHFAMGLGQRSQFFPTHGTLEFDLLGPAAPQDRLSRPPPRSMALTEQEFLAQAIYIVVQQITPILFDKATSVSAFNADSWYTGFYKIIRLGHTSHETLTTLCSLAHVLKSTEKREKALRDKLLLDPWLMCTNPETTLTEKYSQYLREKQTKDPELIVRGEKEYPNIMPRPSERYDRPQGKKPRSFFPPANQRPGLTREQAHAKMVHCVAGLLFAGAASAVPPAASSVAPHPNQGKTAPPPLPSPSSPPGIGSAKDRPVSYDYLVSHFIDVDGLFYPRDELEGHPITIEEAGGSGLEMSSGHDGQRIL
jgi:hypothetical protein